MVILPVAAVILASVVLVGLPGCGNGVQAVPDATGDPAVDVWVPPAPAPVAATRAFRLYYRERVERAIVAYNRFMLFGGTTFGSTIGKVGVSRTGDQWEVVPGPNDNNHIGASVWATWYAYKVFRSRTLALTLIRMFEGLAFLEAISGHGGVTARMVYPGWTRSVDGVAGTVQLTRLGDPAVPPVPPDANLEKEVLAAFFDGVRITYRENPEDILLNYMPVQEVGPYSVTYSFSMLPHYLRVSDCCTSLMRTPAPHPWEGAFWGNHNSRDNFPDLGLGFVAAMATKDDEEADQDLRMAAARAWEAGRRIGDLIQTHDGKLMTVDEHHPYDTLVVAGALRPDGETEAEDLGSLSDCQMVFLARALSSAGLGLPLPVLPAPGSVEKFFAGLLGEDSGCAEPGEIQQCTNLGDAYCGKTWGNIHELEIAGTPWLELARSLEEETPGTAELLMGSFQDDFHEKTLASLALVDYARTAGDEALLEAGLTAVADITRLMRTFADIIYTRTNPGQRTRKRYQAALVDAQAGLEVEWSDLDDFAPALQQIERLEAMLDLQETTVKALLTDEEILQIVEERLADRSKTVRDRYRDAYGETPPVRRSGEGYEARGHREGELWPWAPVDNPNHFHLGHVELLEALPLCITNPELLDCTWARLGCERPDLNQDGQVDEVDQGLFDEGSVQHMSVSCGLENEWCGGADLDRSGIVDETDTAFMKAAAGCHYEVP